MFTADMTAMADEMTPVVIVLSLCLTGLLVTFGAMRHKSKMKALEIEMLRVQKTNVQSEVNHAIDEKMKQYEDRMQVLEEIVTSKNYDLNEKISRIK